MRKRRAIALVEAQILGLPPPPTLFERAMLRIGFYRRNDNGSLRGPIHISPWSWWRVMLFPKNGPCPFQRVGLFRNRKGVIDRVPGSWLPRRWGFFVFGFEFGQRS